MALTDDMLEHIFRMQARLMMEYQAMTPDGIPDWPVDLRRNSAQRFCRDTISKAQDELFEAKHHLKKAKEHRNVETDPLDREAFLEEMVDALHFYVETLVLMGVSADDLHDAYCRKNQINFDRIASEFKK